MCRGCCEYDVIRCKCPLQGTPVGYAVPCCRNAINECDPCIIHPGRTSTDVHHLAVLLRLAALQTLWQRIWMWFRIWSGIFFKIFLKWMNSPTLNFDLWLKSVSVCTFVCVGSRVQVSINVSIWPYGETRACYSSHTSKRAFFMLFSYMPSVYRRAFIFTAWIESRFSLWR